MRNAFANLASVAGGGGARNAGVGSTRIGCSSFANLLTNTIRHCQSGRGHVAARRHGRFSALRGQSTMASASNRRQASSRSSNRAGGAAAPSGSLVAREIVTPSGRSASKQSAQHVLVHHSQTDPLGARTAGGTAAAARP